MATFYIEITEVVQWQLWSEVEGRYYFFIFSRLISLDAIYILCIS